MGKKSFILVEGIADLVLIRDFLKVHYGYTIPKKEINSETKEMVMIKENKDEIKIFRAGGKNPNDTTIQKIEQTYNKYQPDNFVIIFDADNDVEEAKQYIIQTFREKISIVEDQIFLFPNNQYDGDLEIFLEKIVVRQEIIKCWDNFEKCLKSKDKKLTIPVKKSKIRTYLEVLNPNTEKGRKACKEVYRDYTDNTKWDIGNLDIECVKKLKSFLDKYVNE